MATLSWGKPKIEICAFVSGAFPEKRFVLKKAVAVADTTIEIEKGSGVVIGNVIGYKSKSVACTGVVTTDPSKDVVTVTMGVDIPVNGYIYEAAAASADAATGKATWVEISTPKQDSTQMTTSKGTKQEAKEEGGGLVGVRYDKNSYVLNFELFVKKGSSKPIDDIDGIIIEHYAVRLTPEDASLEGFIMDKTSVQIEDTYTTKEGKTWKYSFEGLLPTVGKICKEYFA